MSAPPFATILADPPWTYSDRMLKMQSTGNGAAAKYACMSLTDIAKFLDTLAYQIADDALLWLWCTNAFVSEAHDVARAWRFEPKTLVTWVKGRIEPSTGRLVSDIGQGHYLRNSTEHLVLATRGHVTPRVRFLPTAFVHRGRWPGSFTLRETADHQWCELLDGGPYLELFARRRRAGWTSHGNQLID